MKEERTFVCSACGQSHPIAQRMLFDGQELCPDCAETTTTLCDLCGQRVWLDDCVGASSHHLCQSCYDRYYTECYRCGAIIRLEDAHYHDDDPDEEEPMCDRCHNHCSRPNSINDNYYKPTPIFYGGACDRYFGVELEIDGAGEVAESADRILDIANAGAELVYCKHDGSLDDGFEIVTHPMTYDFHRTKMPWEAVLAEAVAMGYTSHQARTCGLHVHVNRSTFGATEPEQDVRIARVLYFFEKHWEELLKFSRRTETQLKRWAARYGYKEQPMDILDHAKKGYGGGRYSSVNLQNQDTVEFRIFRGTLKYNTLIATLQMIDRICDVALSMSDEELRSMSWTTFVSGCQQPELVQYLKERRLYVNEPVNTEVEL